MVACVKTLMVKFTYTANPACRFIPRSLFAKYFHCHYIDELCIFSRSFRTSQDVLSEKKFRLDPTKIVKEDGTVIKKRTESQPVITLIYNSSEKVLTMNDAYKLAKSKGLYVVKVPKPTEKSMDFYKLSKVPGSSIQLRNDTDNKSKCVTSVKTNMKSYVFKTTTADHDLLVKARGLIKALQKYNVATYIIENKNKAPEKTHELSNKIQQAITDGGLSFEILEEKGRTYYKIFVIQLKNKSPVSADNQDVTENNNNASSSS